MRYIIPVLLIALMIGCAEYDTIKEMFGDRKSIALRVDGDSMHPTIKDGEHVIVDLTVDISDVIYGDVIVYKSRILVHNDKNIVVHRVVMCNGTNLRVKGDHNAVIDGEIVTKRNFVGKVLAKIDFSGKTIQL